MKSLLPTQTLALLATIRNGASDEFKNRIPVATANNLKEWGTQLAENKQLYNEFVGLLVRIGKVIISSQAFTNPLAKFKKGELKYGETIQDIWVEIAESIGVFDPTGANPLTRSKDDVIALYSHINRKDEYKKSISRQQLLNAFTSPERIGDFITEQMNSLYAGSEYDEYLCVLELLGAYKPFYEVYQVPALMDDDNNSGVTITSSNLTQFVKTLRKGYKDLQFMSREHNAMGVMRKSNPTDISVFIRKDIASEIDVEVLANAFNLNKTDLVGKIIEVENFGDSDNISNLSTASGTANAFSTKDVLAVMVENDAIQIYDTLIEMGTIYNPHGLFENYFYHIWQAMFMRKFSNAIAFCQAKSDNTGATTRLQLDLNDIASDVVSVVTNQRAGLVDNKFGYALGTYSYTDKNGATQNISVKVDVLIDKAGHPTLSLPFVYNNVSNAHYPVSVWKLYKYDGTLYTTAKTIKDASNNTIGGITSGTGVITLTSTLTYAGVVKGVALA